MREKPCIDSIFCSAIEIVSPDERRALVERACGEDADLKQQVGRLLHAHFHGRSILDVPVQSVASVDEPLREVAGSTIGAYKLLEQIGEGGFGLVFMAEQFRPVRRRVALKILKAGMDTGQIVARFEAERQALAIMDHPNIARVFDGGATPSGRPFFVMELVRGMPITEFCDQNQLSPRQRLELFVSVCQAVQHAHQKGIIHRDLKPANILVTMHDTTPVPKIIDFGIAKALGHDLTEKTLFTAFTQMIGTPMYMSPEQAGQSGLDADTRSDIYSLGVLLYELLTGSTPFGKDRFKMAMLEEIRRIIREEEPPKPSTRLMASTETLQTISAQRQTEPAKLTKLVKGELDWIVMKALDKDRNRRYETASAFASDVQRDLADEPVLACPPSAGYRLRKIARKYRKVLVTVAAFALLLVGSAVACGWQAIRATQAAEAEQQAKQEAIAATEAEKKALAQAHNRLGQIERGNEIITAIFTDLDIRYVKEEAVPLEAVLAKRLVHAAEQLEGEAVGNPQVVAGLQERLGLSLLNLGHPHAAITLFVKARATRAAELGADHPDTLTSMNNLACGYKDADKLDLAIPLNDETLRLRKAKLGAGHPDTLTSMNNLASCYQDSGKLDLALPLFEETLKLRKATLGTDHPDTLNSMNNLALGYRDAGRLDLALPLFDETLNLQKATLGADHHSTLKSMNNLALGYREVGKSDLALPLFEETLKLRKARLGSDHPDTLAIMHNLADSYRDAGKLDLALPLFEETLKLRKARLGSDHAGTLRTMNALASGYRTAGKLDLALPIFEETLELRKVKLGADHPDTLTSMNNLAEVYRAAGKLDLALPLYEETLRLRNVKLGADHPDTLTSMNNLAVGYQVSGKLDLALPLYQEAAAGIEKRRFRHEHAHLIIPNLCACHEKLNQLDQAEAWRRKWLALVQEQSGADSIAFAAELAALGLNLLQQQKWPEAESTLKECLAIRQKKAPNVWSTFNTQSLLGGALAGQKKYTDAEPLLLTGFEGMKAREKSIPPLFRDVRLREALERIVQLYEVWDKKDKADEWRKKWGEAKRPN